MFFNKNNPRIIICDQKFGIIRDNLKLKFLPREGEFIFFDEKQVYWTVLKIIHNISNKNIVWIVVVPQENNEKS